VEITGLPLEIGDRVGTAVGVGLGVGGADGLGLLGNAVGVVERIGTTVAIAVGLGGSPVGSPVAARFKSVKL